MTYPPLTICGFRYCLLHYIPQIDAYYAAQVFAINHFKECILSGAFVSVADCEESHACEKSGGKSIPGGVEV